MLTTTFASVYTAKTRTLPFLDVLVHRVNDNFRFSVHRKNKNMETNIHNFSSHSNKVKHNVISDLFSRALGICDYGFIDAEIDHLFHTFLGLRYPKYLLI